MDTQQQITYAAEVFQTNVTVRSLLESLAEGVVVVNAKSQIIFFNPRAQELFGYTAAEVKAKPLSVLLPERFVNLHASHTNTYFAHPRRRPMGDNRDLWGRRKNGEEFPIEVSLSYLDTEMGLFGVAYITDISAQRRREQDLKARNQELDAFAHMVAHDLKSSLALQIGLAELLQADYTSMSADQISESLSAIVSAGRKMDSIIEEMLLFASLRNQSVETGPVDSEPLLVSVTQRLQQEIKDKNARIELPQKFVWACGYAPWLEEVWFNYVSNAIKYGGESPVIRVGSEERGETVRFWVTDYGQGLREKDMQGLFEPFSRRHDDSLPGHGLGLSIVKRIITRLNGSVGVTSQPGEGSTFYFILPAVEHCAGVNSSGGNRSKDNSSDG
ncbi:MAG: PAS domain S-box protein [Caldilineaceae bacterium]|nr:PAS domain S-box protein [Caldilineaceae bacterium]